MTDQDKIKQILYDYIRAGLIEVDVDKVLEYLSDHIIGIGMGEQGMVTSKDTIREIISAGKKEEDHTKYEIQYEKVEVKILDDQTATLCARIIINRSCCGETMRSGLMQSLGLHKEGGRWLICLLHASPIMLSEESIEAYPLKFAENTLAHLRAELQIQTLDLMNQSIAGGIMGIYYEQDVLRLYFINDSMLKYLGFTRNEFESRYGKNVLSAIHPDDRNIVTVFAEDLFITGRDVEIRHRIISKDGKYHWMVVRARRGKDDNGNDILMGVFVDVTEMVELQQGLEEQKEALAVSEERFRIALEKTSNLIFDYDIISGNIMHSSSPKKSMDYVSNIKMVKETLVIGGEIMEESLDDLHKAFQIIKNGEEQSECIVKVKLASGKMVWDKISMTGITDNEGNTVRAVGMIEDITRQKEAEIAYGREEQYRQAILADALASYIINYTTGKFEDYDINGKYCVVPEYENSYDKSITEAVKCHLSEADRRAFLDVFLSANVLRAYEEGRTELKNEYKVFNSDGTMVWMKTTVRIMMDSATNEIKGFMYVSDIDQSKREQLELAHKSECDSMTGVYNKATSEMRIKEKLKTIEGVQTGVFMMLDIDRFKDINDTYGHPFGDTVLIKAAKVLGDNFRQSDIVGRLGGDEFCVFFCGIASHRRIEQSAAAICKSMKNIFIPEEGKAGISCSIGIAICGGVSKTFEQLYKEADTALYHVKKNGRNGFTFFE